MTNISDFIPEIYYYIPLGLVGIWRWSSWVFKKSVGMFYRPKIGNYSKPVSIVTPIYNEKPDVLRAALKTWADEKPNEIVAVIDHTDETSISVFNEFSKEFKNAKLIVTRDPGKREALVKGIKEANSEIIALVDCDTLWTKDALKNGIQPFADPKVGGVATRQNVANPNTVARKMFDIELDLRYHDELPFLGAAGDALRCLSGRTAFYRKSVIEPMLDDLVNEYFLGKKVISGDDKRLTYLVQAAGWKTAYQNSCIVLTPGEENLKTFVNQRLRWGRNSWRADMKAVMSKWLYKHPALAFFIIDGILGEFTLLLSLMYLINAIYFGFWELVLIIVLWFLVSRTVKLAPHLARYPQHIVYIPFYIAFSYFSAIQGIFSLITLNSQGWITRWDKGRLPKVKLVYMAAAYAYTLYIIVGIWYLAYLHFVRVERNIEEKNALPASIVVENSLTPVDAQLISTDILDVPTEPLFVRHVVVEGETLSSIAQEYNLDLAAIIKFNHPILANWNVVSAGDILTIPTDISRVNFEPIQVFNYQRKTLPAKGQTYDAATNTITLDGRGHKYTIPGIAASDGYKNLYEEEPGVWVLKADLVVRTGVTLNITDPDVKWLKLESDEEHFAKILAYNARVTIDGVKITSWDSETGNYDLNYDDGRSYILIMANSRMDVYSSELAYLGYKDPDLAIGGTYGVSWRIPSRTFGSNLVTGEIINTEFHHNYFGAYTYGATGMIWRSNIFRDNVVYGLDPHDDSNNFIVEDNIAYGNGTHGIIFSKRCFSNVIRNNKSFNNGFHGIMLHEYSNRNLVENNEVYGNIDGIAIYLSDDNTIRNNIIYGNKTGIRMNEKSVSNLSYSNEIRDSEGRGIYLYGEADQNIFFNNRLENNLYGAYIKTNRNELSNNEILGGTIGIYLLDNASDNRLIKNDISASAKDIYSKTNGDVLNLLSQVQL